MRLFLAKALMRLALYVAPKRERRDWLTDDYRDYVELALADMRSTMK